MGWLVNRRGFLLGAGGIIGGAAASRWLPAAAWARDQMWRVAVAPGGTTLESTIVRVGGGPYRTLAEGPGQPVIVRTDLREPKAGREDRRTAIGAFVHLTDLHLVDAQSPGRVEFLDPDDALFQSAFRPQELLSTHVATSMVDRLNALGGGPITGRSFDCAVSTGDNIDNQQANELTWFLQVLDGGTITPDSGAPGTYEGVQDLIDPLARYFHPDGPPADTYRLDQGYPAIPGLLTAAIAPFASPGLDCPWYSTYGNHDCLVQGNAARNYALDEVLAGTRKMTALPAGEGGIGFILRVMGDSPSVLADLQAGTIPYREVTPDAGRVTATARDWVDAHLGSGGGHGYTADDLAAERLYYEFPVSPGIIGLSLDTTNHAGGAAGADGSIGAGQLAWLEERLAAHHSRYLGADGFVRRGTGDDRLVMIFSHHPAGSMTATDPDPARPAERRVLGAELVSVLLRYPNVVAWVNGHTHTNSVQPHRHPDGATGGFWEVTTASHIDWPQQARILELVDNRDGTLSLFGTLVEHAAPVAVDHGATDRLGLASISRELGANDVQAGPEAKEGAIEAHNVELVLAAPFALGEELPTSTTTTPAAVPAADGAVPVGGAAAYTG